MTEEKIKIERSNDFSVVLINNEKYWLINNSDIEVLLTGELHLNREFLDIIPVTRSYAVVFKLPFMKPFVKVFKRDYSLPFVRLRKTLYNDGKMIQVLAQDIKTTDVIERAQRMDKSFPFLKTVVFRELIEDYYRLVKGREE
jgi:hypothetical protein